MESVVGPQGSSNIFLTSLESPSLKEPPALPAKMGAAVSVNQLMDNLIGKVEAFDSAGVVLEKSVLGRMLRNAAATLKLTYNALQIAGTKVYEHTMEGPQLLTAFRAGIAVLGFSLYAGSLLFSLVLKAAIWIPVMTISLVGGILGATLGGLFGGAQALMHEGEKRTDSKTGKQVSVAEEKFDLAVSRGFQLGANITGNIAGAAASLVAGITVVPRGLMHLFGLIGYGLLQGSWNHTPDKEERLRDERSVLFGAMYQAIEDSYGIWTLGNASIEEYRYNAKDIESYIKAGADPYEMTWEDKFLYPQRLKING